MNTAACGNAFDRIRLVAALAVLFSHSFCSAAFEERHIGTDDRPTTGDTVNYYDASLTARIKSRLRKLFNA